MSKKTKATPAPHEVPTSVVPTQQTISEIKVINGFCGCGKSMAIKQMAVDILKDSSSDKKIVISAPTVQLLLEWCLYYKEIVGEKIYNTRLGRLFNITSEQIQTMANLYGDPRHPVVCAARAMRVSSKGKINKSWSVILTTHTTLENRIGDFGEDFEIHVDEVPIGCVKAEQVTSEEEYNTLLEIASADFRHSAFKKAKAVGKAIKKGLRAIYPYAYTDEGGKTVNCMLEYWNIKSWKVKAVTFYTAMPRWTLLMPLANLNGLKLNIETMGNPSKEAAEAVSRINLTRIIGEAEIELTSKAAHYKALGKHLSAYLKQLVSEKGGYIIGFVAFENTADRNVRFGCAGINSLREMTVVGIDGLPRANPWVADGFRQAVELPVQDPAVRITGLNWKIGFETQVMVQGIWRSAIRDGKTVEAYHYGVDVSNRLRLLGKLNECEPIRVP